MADADIPTLEDLANDLVGDTDVKDEPVEADTTAEESSTEESNEAETNSETEGDESTEEADSDTEETQEQVQQPSKADERKQQLNTEIRDLVTQRRDLMQEVERLNATVYAPQSIEQIMEETGSDEVQARMTAMEQRQELQAYNTQVAEANLVIMTESRRVLEDFPMFNPDSSEFKPDVANDAAQLLRQNLQIDPNTGQVTGSNISPYQLYKTIASANQASAVENQIKGQKNAEKMLASAEPQSSASETKTVPEDPFLTGLTKGYGDRLKTG